ncbi:MAG TPA: prolipoprotein diacylglyceryl transferase family protein [Prolixibacteraceae bacterium]|nr:prolipoprotein diacylglyceryl transferase family protein [Prolixibacteraceae bacterium]
MKQNNQITGKILYAITFLVLLPAGLWLWAKYTGEIIPFPVIESKLLGSILLIAGGFLMLWGMYALHRFGKGLPMNAWSPPVFVTKGPYRLFRHPIYWGFGMITTGYFIFSGSASGLWLVSPVTVMGMMALVLGYEAIDLKRRFPDQFIRTVLDYPENKNDSADLRDRLTCLLWVGSFLIINNFVIQKWHGDVPLLFKDPLQFLPPSENPYLPYLSVVFLAITPFVLKSKDILREWEVSGFIALAYVVFIALLYPGVGAQYFPLHGQAVFAVPVCMLFISAKAMFRQAGILARLMAVIAILLSLIQLLHSRMATPSLLISILIFLLSANYTRIWIFLKNTAEKIANSWKEWTFGKVRVINHGIYVGYGAFFGILLCGILAGKDYSYAILVFMIVCLVFAALWAQIIEGSAKLKRPFGYYGSLAGIPFGLIVVWAMDYNGWIVIGVTSVAMTFVQANGRLRCLVNGCCHGRRSDNPMVGIRYFHPRSRVCNISGLKGELVHPTQLYSILWLTGIGLLLLALWNNGCTPPFIFGLYLILTSLGRFVEEAYRGEVQTPVFGGLHLYQWTAVVVLIIGAVITTIQIEPVIIHPGFNWESVWAGFIGGIFVFFAMGVDFPNSNVRFSRLV